MVENNGTNGTSSTSEPIQVPGQTPGPVTAGQARYQQYAGNPQPYQQPPAQGYLPQQPYPQQPPMPGYGQTQQQQSPMPGYGYQQPPVMQGYAQPQTAEQKQTIKLMRILYGTITIGLIVMVGLGIFLSWLNVQLNYQGTTYHATMNGLGQLSGDSFLVTALQPYITGTKDGVYILPLALIVLVLLIVGLLKPAFVWGAIGIALTGGICTYILANDLIEANNKLPSTVSAAGGDTVGIGLIVSLVGSLMIVGDAMAILVIFRRLKKGNQPLR